MLLAMLVGFSSPASAFNLVEAYNSALSYNADYLGAIAKNKAGQEDIKQARSAFLPQIGASATENENYISSQGAEGYYHQPVLGITLSQVVFDFSKFSAYTKAKYSTQLADLQLKKARQKLMVDVAQAYFGVLYAKDVMSSIQMTKAAFAKQLVQAKKSFEVGTVTIADVNEAQSGFDTAQAQEIQAQNDVINKKNILRNMTGLDPELIQPVVSKITLANPTPNNVNEWSRIANAGNMDVGIAIRQLQMAHEDILIARSGHFPTLNVQGTYNNYGTQGIDNNAQIFQQSANTIGTPLSSYSQAVVGLQLNIPISAGGAITSQVRKAIANYEVSNQQLVSTRRQTDQNVQNAFWQVENGVGLVKAQTQALKSAGLKLKADTIGYKVGIRSSVDLAGSEKNYYKTLQDYNQARYNYLIYRLQLKYLSGNIDVDYLKKINSNIKF